MNTFHAVEFGNNLMWVMSKELDILASKNIDYKIVNTITSFNQPTLFTCAVELRKMLAENNSELLKYVE